MPGPDRRSVGRTSNNAGALLLFKGPARGIPLPSPAGRRLAGSYLKQRKAAEAACSAALALRC